MYVITLHAYKFRRSHARLVHAISYKMLENGPSFCTIGVHKHIDALDPNKPVVRWKWCNWTRVLVTGSYIVYNFSSSAVVWLYPFSSTKTLPNMIFLWGAKKQTSMRRRCWLRPVDWRCCLYFFGSGHRHGLWVQRESYPRWKPADQEKNTDESGYRRQQEPDGHHRTRRHCVQICQLKNWLQSNRAGP